MRLNYLTDFDHLVADSDEQVFMAYLTTKGRKTGKEHTVMLRGVKHNGRYYFSRHRPDGDWFQNAIKNPKVVIEVHGKKIKGSAKQVLDESLSQKISHLKYPGEERAKEKRVTIEITQCE